MRLPQPFAIASHRIHPDTRPAYVRLKVANLENQLLFYQQVIGLELNWRKEKSAGLGVSGRDLVRLTHLPGGQRYRGVTGIYHFALLFPNRRELARAIGRLFALRWPNSPTDHAMTKTTYLSDSEGNEIELYCESPEDEIFSMNEKGGIFCPLGGWSSQQRARTTRPGRALCSPVPRRPPQPSPPAGNVPGAFPHLRLQLGGGSPLLP